MTNVTVTAAAYDAQRATREDHELAAELAQEAGELLVRVRADFGFEDPKALKDLGDRESQKLLSARLEALRPDDAVLSEEADDDQARLTASRVWIIDPLDGTREFSEEGRIDWAVHVALWVDGRLAAGAVALPADRVVHSTAAPAPRTSGADASPRLLVSRTRPPELVERISQALGGTSVPMGSAGAKAMAVVSGEADAYVHSGGQYEWDSAAPVAVAIASGLFAARIDGSPLAYNASNPYLPDLVICVPELADPLLALLASQ